VPAVDALRWNARYREGRHEYAGGPRPYLTENAHHLPTRGWALDVAMGRGAAAGFLIDRGLNVIGADIASVAVRAAKEDWPTLNAVVADLTCFELRASSLDLIVNFYYLERSLWPAFRRMLKPGGVLVLETLTQAMCLSQPDTDPAFLLAPGELPTAFADWEILDYREGWNTPHGRSRRATAGIVARRP